MANTLESVIVGYFAGVVVGSLIIVFLIGWILVKSDEMGLPDWYVGLVDWTKEFHTPNPTAFEIAFILGFLSGLGGSSSAANNKRKDDN